MNNRRHFLKGIALFSLVPLMPKKLSAEIKTGVTKIKNNFFPIQSVSLNAKNSTDFNGDNITRPHDILWDLANYIKKKGGIPTPSEKRDVVVIGAGMSGLIAAYQLREFNPLILEQDNVFGGNSKGERYNKSTYSIGAAYVTIPDKGSDIDQFFREIGLHQEFKHEKDHETKFVFKQSVLSDFWKGKSDPGRASEFEFIAQKIRDIYENAYPEIPWTKESDLSFEEFKKLDQITFADWMTKNWGDVHPHIVDYFERYCWSSFAGSIDELSAAQVLNFICAEVDGVLTLPGGNAQITERLCQKLTNSLSTNSMRAGAFIVNVEIKNANSTWVTYENLDGVFVTINTKKVIFSAPKFVAKKVLKDLPEAQLKAMEKIRYRGYVVTNAIYDGVIPSPGFDLFWLSGKRPEPARAMTPPSNYLMDVCFGTWAQNDKCDESILTMYRPLAFDGARQFLFSPFAHQKNLNRSMVELEQFLKPLNIDPKKIKGYRLTRWGHSLPLAEKGFCTNGMSEIINRPIGNNIFFVNQDNYANPAFECCFATSLEVTNTIKKSWQKIK